MAGQYRRVSMGAVESILADVYLTYAGAAINGGAAYYAESAKHSLAVIQNGGYTLFPNYTDMIKPANKNKGEFIFQVQYAASVPSTNPLTPLRFPIIQVYQNMRMNMDLFIQPLNLSSLFRPAINGYRKNNFSLQIIPALRQAIRSPLRILTSINGLIQLRSPAQPNLISTILCIASPMCT